MTEVLAPRGRYTLLGVATLTIMVGCVIVPGLPAVAEHLEAGVGAGWLVTLPSLGVVLFGPLAALLLNRLGLRAALMLGLFLYGLLGVVGAFLQGTVAVLGDRLLLGGATAVVMAAGTGLIAEFYQGTARTAMIAKQGMAIELGGVIFLFVAGILATLSWNYPFVLYLLAWVLLLLVKSSIPPDSSARAAEPASEPAGLQPALQLAFVAAGLSMIVFFTAVIVLPMKLQALGLDAAKTGYFLSFVSLVAVCAAAAMPIAIARFSDKGTLIIGMVCYTLAHVIFGVSSHMLTLVVGAIFLGMGFGLTIPTVNHMTVEYSAAPARMRNLAYLSMAIFLGQFLASFMEWMPGTAAATFLTAAGISVMAAVGVSLRRA